MITIRKAEDRGHFDHGWLDTYHSFSFAGYYNPRHMGFRSLRVINEDWIQPGRGFGTHPHHDMEIITYVLEGALEHKDSTGGGGVIRPGEVQYMSAGTGVTHSEFNHSSAEAVHLLQIWIEPAKQGLEPGYDQKSFAREAMRGRLTLIASPDAAERPLTIQQDARIYACVLETGQQLSHDLAPGRHAWLQLAHGRVQVNGQRLAAGDGAAVSDESRLYVTAEAPAELLLFDRPEPWAEDEETPMSHRAKTDHPVHDLIAKRWSPYGFSVEAVPDEDLRSLFEAARWAASSYNEQPWSYIVATREDARAFDRLLSCLAEPNQAWARHAPVLALGVAHLRLSRNDKPNRHAWHDLGLASAQLTLEATARGLFVHQMAGFVPDKARELYAIPDGREAVTALAIGHAGDNPELPDALKQRDRSERSRRPLAEFVFGDSWGKATSVI